MSEGIVQYPDELPCEKCGKMTYYDGTMGAKAPCMHCGAPRPHTTTGSSGFLLIPFFLFFVLAIIMAVIDPLGMGEALIIPLFGIFLLIFLGLFAVFVFGAMKAKRELRQREEKEQAELSQDSNE